jgi:hypothetical protein
VNSCFPTDEDAACDGEQNIKGNEGLRASERHRCWLLMTPVVLSLNAGCVLGNFFYPHVMVPIL